MKNSKQCIISLAHYEKKIKQTHGIPEIVRNSSYMKKYTMSVYKFQQHEYIVHVTQRNTHTTDRKSSVEKKSKFDYACKMNNTMGINHLLWHWQTFSNIMKSTRHYTSTKTHSCISLWYEEISSMRVHIYTLTCSIQLQITRCMFNSITKSSDVVYIIFLSNQVPLLFYHCGVETAELTHKVSLHLIEDNNSIIIKPSWYYLACTF